ncbi:MAG: D-alanine--D-alanine ligase [Actinomycetales bacterium]
MKPPPQFVVDVLAGSLSPERDVSLRSGRRVADSLRQLGVSVVERDLDASTLDSWRRFEGDCVVPLVHGAAGEDGALATLLEVLDLPFVGSTSAACRLAFDKAVAKAHLRAHGIATPAFVALPQTVFRELGASELLDSVVDHLGLPLVVKPTRGGSAMGVSLVERPEQLPAAMMAAFAYSDTVLMEQFVAGTELAVCMLQDGEGLRALPSISIDPPGPLYDYDARYTAGLTQFTCPADLPEGHLLDAVDTALAAHRVFGLRDWSRADLIVDGEGRPWVLEVNAAPGMTETSLYPQALVAAGLDLGGTVLSLVQQAAGRSPG